jgi:hypothetical protein
LQEISMMKRSFFLSLAAGLLASLAFATPSQAGGTLVTTTLEFVGPLSPAATSIVIDYTLTSGSISELGGLASSAPGTTLSGTSDTATLSFSPGVTSFTVVKFTFLESAIDFPVSPANIMLASVTAQPGGQNVMMSTALSFAPAVVPEPSSMALLGIGMTGFFAFRRLFKRVSVA